MATLKCKSCEENLSSSARRVQCPHCGELFPFACARCAKSMRPPLSVFDDERYLTLDSPPQALCDEHYLRKCPDCDEWFGADENPGYFRCASCAEIHTKRRAAEIEAPEAVYAPEPNPQSEGGVALKSRQGGAAARPKSAGGNPNAMPIGFAVCAFLALVAWMLLNR